MQPLQNPSLCGRTPLSLAWANFSNMMECTPESGHCHSMCTLSTKHWSLLTVNNNKFSLRRTFSQLADESNKFCLWQFSSLSPSLWSGYRRVSSSPTWGGGGIPHTDKTGIQGHWGIGVSSPSRLQRWNSLTDIFSRGFWAFLRLMFLSGFLPSFFPSTKC